MKRILPFLIILVVLGVAIGSGWYLTRVTPGSPAANPAPTAQSTATANQQQRPAPIKGIPGAEPAQTLGPANAPVQLEEFGDYQCPPCGMFHPILVQMHQEFGDKVRITFRNFPLVQAHVHAAEAAAAAEAAGLQGKFWPMHDLIYEHQNDWKDKADVAPIFEGYAQQIGLDVARWKKDSGSEQVAQRIYLDSKRGQSMGVKGTPTVFINGREVPFEQLPAEKLRLVIQYELNAAAGSR
ncbi:MAG TPA: thioredoxin domain-containing protein [Pyrinomonadaceae bacterium]|nr:thioredoxin domain-containing protein [Pyrinomonadaceae bacterium]